MFKTSSQTRLLILLGIVFFAFALRMMRIGELRMWGDEAFSVYSAHRSVAAITFEGAENDPHPPLYYYLLHVYMPLAGASELALRFFSVFPGVATVALLYCLGRRLFDTRVGLAAAALAAIAPFDIYYSQEIRMYALAIFLTALALYYFVRLLQGEDGDRRLWFAYALVMFLALYSLYHTAFVFLAEGLYLLTLFKQRRAFVRRWFAVASGVVILFLPWLVLRFSSTLGHLEDRAGHNIQALPVFAARGFAALTAGTTISPTNALALSIVFGLLIVIGLVVAWKTHKVNRNDGLLLVLAAVPIIAVYPLYLLLPILVARLFALAFVPLVLVLARSLALLDRRAMVVFLVAIGAISAYSLGDYYFRFDRYNAAAEDYIPAIKAVERSARRGDVVLFHAYWQIGYFLSHYQGPPIEYRALDNLLDVGDAVAQPRNVWAIVQGLSVHGSEIWLAQHAFPVAENKFGQMRVLAFRAGTPARGEQFAVPVLFSNDIALLGYRLNGEPVESGTGLVTIELDWQAMQKIADDYMVSVRLTNAHGDTIWAQDDAPPAAGTLPTSTWRPNQVITDRHAFAILPGTPPGTYNANVVMYTLEGNRAANIVSPENLSGQSLSLGTIEVSRPRDVVPIPKIPNLPVAQWNEISLAGFESGVAELMPGDTLPLTLYWRAVSKPARDYLATLNVVDAAGAVRASATWSPANETFPTRAWNAGETWIDKSRLTIDAGAASGEASIWVGLVDAQSGETVSAAGGKQILLAHVQIHAREHRMDLPPPQHPLDMNFDNKIKLLGADWSDAPLKPAGVLKLGLDWQALAPMNERYTVFVHLLNSAGELIAQRDSESASGSAPTTSWIPGEVVADALEIQLPDQLAPGEYTLEIGVYQAAKGKRLPILGQDIDHALLAHLRIVQP